MKLRLEVREQWKLVVIYVGHCSTYDSSKAGREGAVDVPALGRPRLFNPDFKVFRPGAEQYRAVLLFSTVTVNRNNGNK